MSVELIVYLRREQLPTSDNWQQAIVADGIHLQLEQLDTGTQTGFWPVKLDGADCGFEYSFNRIDADEPEEILETIGDRDHRATFVIHSSMNDCRAASFAASVLAKIANGVFSDPQSGELIDGVDAVDHVKSQDRTERQMKMDQATKKWGALTQRRCPECNAPCPEYRPTCFVCGHRLGRG